MSGLIKELLLDYGMNRLSIDQRSDITTAIESLYTANVLSNDDLIILNEYISGYTAIEIAHRYRRVTGEIENQLIRIFQAIEYASGYTDTNFVRRIEKSYSRYKINRLNTFLMEHGKHFLIHDLSECAVC